MSSNTSFETLPAELVALVAAELNIEDVLSCVQASKAWHAAWAESTVAASLCGTFFPGLARPHTLSAFQGASRRYLRRRDGRFTSWYHHVLDCTLKKGFSFDRTFHPDGEPPSGGNDHGIGVYFQDYHAGVIAWTVGNRRVVLDNLHTRKRRVIDLTEWCPEGNVAFGRNRWSMHQESTWRRVYITEILLVMRPVVRGKYMLCVQPQPVKSKVEKYNDLTKRR